MEVRKMNKRMVHIEFDAVSENESLARVVVSSITARLNPTIEQLNDIKTAVSEAVTNAVIHGYKNGEGIVAMDIDIDIDGNMVIIEIEDKGVGIEDVDKAMEPMYTTRPEDERSGMGFVFMEIFMDELKVESKPGEGTKVTMKKMIPR